MNELLLARLDPNSVISITRHFLDEPARRHKLPPDHLKPRAFMRQKDHLPIRERLLDQVKQPLPVVQIEAGSNVVEHKNPAPAIEESCRGQEEDDAQAIEMGLAQIFHWGVRRFSMKVVLELDPLFADNPQSDSVNILTRVKGLVKSPNVAADPVEHVL